MADSTANDDFEERQAVKQQAHTSIIYFHGMGTPRRYEEPSRVLDTLDRYAYAQPDQRVGILRDQKVGVERSRVGEREPVTFIDFGRFIRKAGSATRRVGRYRLYESYWSPAAAGGLSALVVLGWVLLRTLNPFAILLRPWRAQQRLKLTYLNRLFHDRGALPAKRFAELAQMYRAFEGMPARRIDRSGRFPAFEAIIRAQTGRDPQARKDLLGLAWRWKRAFTRSQVGVGLFAATVLASLYGLLTLAVYLGAFVMTFIAPGQELLAGVTSKARGVPVWLALFGAIFLFASIFFAESFLRNFLADVVYWTTTWEKDVRNRKRRDILRACEDTLQHVLKDPACERIVIVAHSLGTAIAYETLLNLGRQVAAEQRDLAGQSPLEERLRKVSHVITLGSPIDRIAYFFGLAHSRYHRFNRVADTLMGNTADAPFRINRARVIQWINIRDASDPVASRLFSARGQIPNRDEIQEVEIASSHVPHPARAHTGYFDAELSARVLFDVCIFGRSALQLQHRRSRASRWWACGARWIFWAASFTTAWSLALGASGFWWERPLWMALSQQAIGLAMATIVMVGLIGGVWDRLERLTLPA